MQRGSFVQDPTDSMKVNVENELNAFQTNHTTLKNLTYRECIRQYTAPIISKVSDVLLISYDDSAYPLLLWGILTSSLVGPSMKNSSVTEHAEDWSVEGFHIRYCFCQPVEEQCTLQFSLAIMIVVILCNLVKTVCMVTIAWKKDTEPLMTLGDAIASFVDTPDPTTVGNCVAGKSRFEQSTEWEQVPIRWRWKPLCWYEAASDGRWFSCIFLYEFREIPIPLHSVLPDYRFVESELCPEGYNDK